MSIKNFSVQISDSEKLLGVTIDRSLSFNEHLCNLCKKTSMKTAAITRTFPEGLNKKGI